MSDVISPAVAQVLPGLFWERVRRSPGAVAYTFYDVPSNRWLDLTWAQMAEQVSQWQQALKATSLQKGERVAVMANNSPQWLIF
ncbi:MAG TPA: long-chain fatty acid--CoA ligase, partial [Candidatus Tenderia electrophaga]|nr:long-chain fatty acid--CoA ligase [Candidatus Tenderia electrophaga]